MSTSCSCEVISSTDQPITVRVVSNTPTDIVADVVAGVLLIALPYKLFMGIKLGKGLRALLLTGFGANLLTLVFSAIHAGYGFGPDRVMEGIMAHVEVR